MLFQLWRYGVNVRDVVLLDIQVLLFFLVFTFASCALCFNLDRQMDIPCYGMPVCCRSLKLKQNKMHIYISL